MPTVIDVICDNCKEQVQCEFHADGSVKARRCRCEGPGYGEGDAYLRPHYGLLKIAKSANSLLDCLAEFGNNVAGGTCLCSSCAERIETLGGSVAFAKEFGVRDGQLVSSV